MEAWRQQLGAGKGRRLSLLPGLRAGGHGDGADDGGAGGAVLAALPAGGKNGTTETRKPLSNSSVDMAMLQR